MAKPSQLPSGHWRIKWHDENGKRRSATFQTYREAVYQQNLRESETTEISRGLRSPTPTPRKFIELCEKFLACRSSQKRRPRDDEGIIRVHLRPAFGETLIHSIGVEQIDDYKLAKRYLQPKTVHHQLTLLITMLNYARDLGWISKTPKIKKPKIVLFDKDFHFLRTREEINRLLLSASDESKLAHALYATAVFTGLRQGELAGLKWSDVDFEKRLMTVQRSFDGPTKSGDVRHVPILDSLLPMLRAWRLQSPLVWVFPNENGTMQKESARIFQEVFHRVLTRAKFPKIEQYGKQRHYIVFHDLRHTFASHWVMNCGDIFKLQKILGHKSVQMTMRYAHLAPEAFASDYSRLGTFNHSDTPSSIISFTTSSANF